MKRKIFLLVVMFGSLAIATLSAAQSPQKSHAAAGPEQVIIDVTQRIMEVVAEANTYFDQDPDLSLIHI